MLTFNKGTKQAEHCDNGMTTVRNVLKEENVESVVITQKKSYVRYEPSYMASLTTSPP